MLAYKFPWLNMHYLLVQYIVVHADKLAYDPHDKKHGMYSSAWVAKMIWWLVLPARLDHNCSHSSAVLALPRLFIS
jgi:hypothetical protein